MTKATRKVLEHYQARKITRVRAAELLECSERAVTRLMKEAELVRDPAPFKERRERSAARKARLERTTAAALLVKKNQLSVEKAAKKANCHPRTIYRHLELL